MSVFRSYFRFSFLANVTFVTPVFDVFIPSQTRMDFTAFLLPFASKTNALCCALTWTLSL